MILRPGAAGLDVGQHIFEVAHAGGEALHLAETLMHRVELFAHLLKGFPKAFFERALQFFVDRAAHLLELFLVGLAHLTELLADGGAQPFKALLVGLDQGLHLCGDNLELLFLNIAQLANGGGERLGSFVEAARNFLAKFMTALGGFFAPIAQLSAHRLFGGV